MTTKVLELYLPLLKGVEVTGKDEPPALEGSAYAFEHLGFLGTEKAKLTGKVEVIVDTETIEVVFASGNVPAIQLEVTLKDWTGPVLPHRIQLVSKKISKGRSHECKCPCHHQFPGIEHIVSCCSPCRLCSRNIASGLGTKHIGTCHKDEKLL